MDNNGAVVVRGPIDVIGSEVTLVQNADGLWNASLMGRQGGREWKEFHRGENVQLYIKELARQLEVSESRVVQYEAPTSKGAGGTTWIHRRLAFRFLAHQSPKFAVWADGVLERYLKGEITTEESKAVKKTMDELLEQGRLKYEQAEKQLQAAHKDLAVSEGQRTMAEANQKKFWRQVDHATAEVDDLKKQLGLKRQTAVKRKRKNEGKAFLQELSRVLQEYRDGVAGPWPEVEEQLGTSVPSLVAHWDKQMSSGWLGRDLGMFGELPGKKGNPVQWNVLFSNVDIDSCRFDNIMPARNHESKAKLWVSPGGD